MNLHSMSLSAALLAALLCEVTTLTAFAQEPPSEVAGSIVPLDGPASAGKPVTTKLRITKDAPSFKRTDPSAEEKHKYPGEWVANYNNPRKVTFWRHGRMDPVITDFFHTFDNYTLSKSESGLHP